MKASFNQRSKESRRGAPGIMIARGIVELLFGSLGVLWFIIWMIQTTAELGGAADLAYVLFNSLIGVPLSILMLFCGINSFVKPSAYIGLNIGLGVVSTSYILIAAILSLLFSKVNKAPSIAGAKAIPFNWLLLLFQLAPGIAIIVLTLIFVKKMGAKI